MSELKEDRFYPNILASIQDGVIVVSKDLKITELNPAAEKICYTSVAASINKPLESILSDNPHLLDLTKKTLLSGSSYIDKEYKFFQRKRELHIFLGVTISPLSDSSGECLGIVIILRDITLIKEDEEQIQRAERLASLGVLAASMAHEIKNPLSGIKGASQLLKYEVKREGLCEYVDVIIKEVNRIDRIVNDLLSLSSPRKPEIVLINIHMALERILLLQKESEEGKNVVFHQRYDPSLPLLCADKDQVFQLFLNLIKNAIEAMPDGGDLFITTKILLDYHLVARETKKPTQMVVIEIKDTGCGISEEQVKDIFTPFFTTKKRGSGLGLATCSHIVEAHKGRIKILNNKDSKGLTVQVFLPLRQ